MAKSADSPSFVALAFLNGVEYRNFDFKRFICDELATSCKNLVNFGPVTPEFMKGKYVHPVVDQQFGYAAPLLDLAEISTEFSGAITNQFCFTYTLEGVTAMPRELHARLCHAFLVMLGFISYKVLVSLHVCYAALRILKLRIAKLRYAHCRLRLFVFCVLSGQIHPYSFRHEWKDRRSRY